jgi:hypothetical protein
MWLQPWDADTTTRRARRLCYASLWLLTHFQAVLTLFSSIGAVTPPPVSEAVAAAPVAGCEADAEQLLPMLRQIQISDGEGPCDCQQTAAPVNSAASGRPQPHAAGAAEAAADRARIREWMQVVASGAGRAQFVQLLFVTGIVTLLQSTASQFTEYGFRQLKAQVRPSELFVLFRNNHFRCPSCIAAAFVVPLFILSYALG